jgi:hypothetical protein
VPRAQRESYVRKGDGDFSAVVRFKEELIVLFRLRCDGRATDGTRSLVNVTTPATARDLRRRPFLFSDDTATSGEQLDGLALERERFRHGYPPVSKK